MCGKSARGIGETWLAVTRRRGPQKGRNRMSGDSVRWGAVEYVRSAGGVGWSALRLARGDRNGHTGMCPLRARFQRANTVSVYAQG